MEPSFSWNQIFAVKWTNFTQKIWIKLRTFLVLPSSQITMWWKSVRGLRKYDPKKQDIQTEINISERCYHLVMLTYFNYYYYEFRKAWSTINKKRCKINLFILKFISSWDMPYWNRLICCFYDKKIWGQKPVVHLNSRAAHIQPSFKKSHPFLRQGRLWNVATPWALVVPL